MLLSEPESRARFIAAPSAVLATADGDGRPHVVPVTFAVLDDHLWIAVDDKPKRTTDLRRLRNIAANPRVSLLVDHYDDDWTRLWWTRADGTARVTAFDELDGRLLAALQRRYSHYVTNPPSGAVIDVDVERWSGWSFA